MVQRVGEPRIKTRTKHNCFDLRKIKRENHTASAVEQGWRSLMGNQARVKNLAIGTRIDLNDNVQGTINGSTKQIYGLAFPQRIPQQPRKQGQNS